MDWIAPAGFAPPSLKEVPLSLGLSFLAVRAVLRVVGCGNFFKIAPEFLSILACRRRGPESGSARKRRLIFEAVRGHPPDHVGWLHTLRGDTTTGGRHLQGPRGRHRLQLPDVVPHRLRHRAMPEARHPHADVTLPVIYNHKFRSLDENKKVKVHPVIAYFWLCRGRGFPLPNVHGWRRMATINQPPWRGELLHSCSSAQLQDMACITDTAPEQEDPMHSSLHSCTLGQKAPRRSFGFVGGSWGRQATYPSTQNPDEPR
jgi:hypothetical protein